MVAVGLLLVPSSMRFIHPRKLLAFAYWELRRIISAISDPWLLDWRAMTFLGGIEVGLILCLFEFGSLLLGRSLIPARGSHTVLFCVVLVGTVARVNYYAIQHEHRWKTFEREFEQYSALRKTIGCVVMIALSFLTFAAMAWAASAMLRLPH